MLLILCTFLSNVLFIANCILSIRLLLLKKPKMKIIGIASCVVVILIESICFVKLNTLISQAADKKTTDFLNGIEEVVLFLVITVCILLIYRKISFSMFFSAIVYYMYESAGVSIVIFALKEKFKDENAIQCEVIDMSVRFLLLILLTSGLLIARKKEEMAIRWQKSNIMSIIIFVLINIVTAGFLQKENLEETFSRIAKEIDIGVAEKIVDNFTPIILCFEIAVYIAVTVFFIRIVRLMWHSEKLETEVFQYESVQERNKEIFAAYHDYQNNLQSIAHFLDRKDVQGASEYMKDLLGDIPSGEDVYLTGNTYLDRFLSGQQVIASKLNVDITFFGVFPTEGIRNTDICTCFGNALKNAIEACGAQEEVNKVTVKSKIVHDRVYVQIINPIVESKTIRLTDHGTHGYGLPNIESTVQKYDGQMIIDTDDPEKFKLSFDLQFKK